MVLQITQLFFNIKRIMLTSILIRLVKKSKIKINYPLCLIITEPFAKKKYSKITESFHF